MTSSHCDLVGKSGKGGYFFSKSILSQLSAGK